MSEGIDRYDAEQIAESKANEAYYQAVREFESELRIEREDNRTSHQDIRDGLAELSDRIWNIEVKLGIRENNGKWVGYGTES